MRAGEAGALAVLARALCAAAQSQKLSAAESSALEMDCPRGACSLRLVFPLAPDATRVIVIVSSDLRRPRRPTTYWATTGERSLVGSTLSTGRTAAVEGPSFNQFGDLRQLNESEGATSFLCIPVLLLADGPAPHPAVAALLLSYPDASAASHEELRQALLLAGRLSRHHAPELYGYAARVHAALHPSEHARWGPGFDDDYPEMSDSEEVGDGEEVYEDDAQGLGPAARLGASEPDSGSAGSEPHLRNNGSGGAGRGPAQAAAAAAAAGWAMSPRTLRFANAGLERRFQLWRNSRLARVDASTLLSLLAYHAACCFAPPSARGSLAHTPAAGGWAPGIPWLPCGVLPALTVLVPLLLLLLSQQSQSWYSRHRDALLVGTYMLLVCQHCMDLPQLLLAAPEGLWRAVVLRVECAWCVMLGIILQVQFVGQVLMLAGALALKALVAQPRSAAAVPAFLPVQLALRSNGCSLDSAARALLLHVALPCGLAYYLELSARRAFCRTTLRAAR